MSANRPATFGEARSLAGALFAAGLASVDPRRKVAERLGAGDLRGDGLPIVLAIGKAATAMATGVHDVLGDRIEAGIILTKDGHAADPLPGFTVYEASHPVPDQRGLDATGAILDTVRGLKRDQHVLTLISGGGSALLELPRPPVTLTDLQLTTSLLLRAGAPIQHLNAVRSELSQVKGGGLRERIGDARCITLILSDVLGNDPEVIASGPTIRREADPQRALRLLDQYGVTGGIPHSVLDALAHAAPHRGSTGTREQGDVFEILADNDTFVDAINAHTERAGMRTDIAWRQQEGEAKRLAMAFVDHLASTPDDVDVVIGGGEATVTVTGHGIGGRNTEFALAAGLGLRDMTGGEGWAVASLASDGQDGSVDAAGAITSADSVRRAVEGGLDPEAALADNDSGGFFGRTGELVRTGPTGTNVNDVYLGVRIGPDSI